MQIKDKNGKLITITDLDQAINQAAEFKDFKHTDSNYKKLDRQLNQYWKDLHAKLLELKNGKIKTGKLPTR